MRDTFLSFSLSLSLFFSPSSSRFWCGFLFLQETTTRCEISRSTSLEEQFQVTYFRTIGPKLLERDRNHRSLRHGCIGPIFPNAMKTHTCRLDTVHRRLRTSQSLRTNDMRLCLAENSDAHALSRDAPPLKQFVPQRCECLLRSSQRLAVTRRRKSGKHTRSPCTSQRDKSDQRYSFVVA